ncbi:MAG: TIGR02266 family protein [Pseudomonadota bacterium]
MSGIDEKKRSQLERRSSMRVSVEMWVEESTDRELYFQRSTNISIGGIFLEHTVPHPKGTVVQLQFTLPGDSRPLKVKGEIVNVGEGAEELGMGVKFLNLSAKDRQRLEAFLENVLQKSDE